VFIAIEMTRNGETDKSDFHKNLSDSMTFPRRYCSAAFHRSTPPFSNPSIKIWNRCKFVSYLRLTGNQDSILAKGEQARFRIASTEHAASIMAPALCREVLPSAKKVRLEFVALRDSGFEELTRGGLDLLLSTDDTYPPSQLQSEVIYKEELVCVVAAKSAYTRRLTIKQYLEAEHVGLSGVAGSRFTPEKLLGAKGHKRRVVVRVPYSAAAIQCVAGTNLIATVPKRFALIEQQNPAIKILQPPAQLSGFEHFMIWHPRVNMDAAHVWLRTAILQVAKTSLA
jgi:DNA-binding transcriptional LysR family regulator